MEEPIIFEPIPFERVWGGRRFETVLGKTIPRGSLVGEMWEVVDRDEAQSVVHSGPLVGRTLHDLWTGMRGEIFGEPSLRHPSPRFPLLVKLLDARETLSVQVHPPAHLAESLAGEPKTEAWYFLDSLPGSKIYAGLKMGATRDRFERALRSGDVERELHEIPVVGGESIFIPSGRLHAIGGGNLIIEVQQNSDTTFRVFDWNRVGLDGNPRTLHLEESLVSIDFEDFEPQVSGSWEPCVASCEFFDMRKVLLGPTPCDVRPPGRFAIVTPIGGEIFCCGKSHRTGSFLLLPACGDGLNVSATGEQAEILVTTLPA